jgi:hypothetical protein
MSTFDFEKIKAAVQEKHKLTLPDNDPIFTILCMQEVIYSMYGSGKASSDLGQDFEGKIESIITKALKNDSGLDPGLSKNIEKTLAEVGKYIKNDFNDSSRLFINGLNAQTRFLKKISSRLTVLYILLFLSLFQSSVLGYFAYRILMK